MRTLNQAILILGLLLLSATLWAASTTMALLKQVQVVKTSSTTTQLIFNFTASTPFTWFVLTHPNRFVVDFKSANNAAPLTQLSWSQTLVKQLRQGHPNPNELRIVFDLTQPVTAQLNPLPSTSDYPFRLQMTLKSQPSTINTITTVDQSSNNTLESGPQPTWSLSNIPPRKVVVVIDPGHGGKDPGATGPQGLHEKDVVLAIARDIYHDLQKTPGMTVYMTRYNDNYIGLRQRLQIARQDKADIFIAIHADAYKDSDSVGASIFALSTRGASSEAARWLAEKENYSELAGVNLNGKNTVLRSVLIDLSQTATISSSLWLGTDILKQIGAVSPLHKNKVEQAPFVVLKSPDIPSVLIETGFISNPTEERALSSHAYQQKLADAIMIGINQYFRQHPPSGTMPVQYD